MHVQKTEKKKRVEFIELNLSAGYWKNHLVKTGGEHLFQFPHLLAFLVNEFSKCHFIDKNKETCLLLTGFHGSVQRNCVYGCSFVNNYSLSII